MLIGEEIKLKIKSDYYFWIVILLSDMNGIIPLYGFWMLFRTPKIKKAQTATVWAFKISIK